LAWRGMSSKKKKNAITKIAKADDKSTPAAEET